MAYDALAVHVADASGEVSSVALTPPAYLSGEGVDRSVLLESLAAQTLVLRASLRGRPVLNRLRRGKASPAWVGAVPVGRPPEILAILAFFRKDPRTLSGSDLRILRAVNPKLTAALENARVFKSSTSEQMPAVGKARSLFQCLDTELARARRLQTCITVLQCSICGVMSTAGYPLRGCEGKTLDRLAAMLGKHCREYDFSARKGDELVLVLPGFRREDLPKKRAMIQRLAKQAGEHRGEELSIAVGEAFFPEDGSDAEDLLAIAALRLHRSRDALCANQQKIEAQESEPALRAIRLYSTQ